MVWQSAGRARARQCRGPTRARNWNGIQSTHQALNLDETGWRSNRAKRLLWAFVAASCTVAAARGIAVPIRLLGAAFQGVHCGYVSSRPKSGALAERHLRSPYREIRNLATAPSEHKQRLFTFLDREMRRARQQQRRSRATYGRAVA